MTQATEIIATPASESSELPPLPDATGSSELLPLPDANITTRLATMDDLPFIDSLQKQYSKQLGFFPRAQMEGYIQNGWVLVAEEAGGRQSSAAEGVSDSNAASRSDALQVGYCASRDRYLKRDELGVIYQLCVAPGRQRGLIGANLLKAVFERASYGCKLYCCWCAQDLAANKFWEAMGFAPLAFRAGSEKKARTHIFWQKRIRAEDTATPWWFPSKTEGGSIRADRLVLPIPPGVRWDDVMPVLLPGQNWLQELPQPQKRGPVKKAKQPAPVRRQFGPPSMQAEPAPKPNVDDSPAPSRKPKQPKPKTDPKLIAAARELRDRWLENVNDVRKIGAGKYQIVREASPMKQLRARQVEIKRFAA